MRRAQIGRRTVAPRTAEQTLSKANHLDSILVAATFSAEPLMEFLSFWARTCGWSLKVEFAPLGQVFQPLLSAGGKGESSNAEIRLVLLRMDDWADTPANLERTISEFIGTLHQIAENTSQLHLVCICPSSIRMSANPFLSAAINRAENLLRTGLAGLPYIVLFGGKESADQYAVETLYDETSDALGGIPYTSEFYAAVATTVFRKIAAANRTPLKAVVSDCDNTLWRGIVAEDGVDGLQITAANRKLYQLLSAQKGSGILLCLCSKNEEADIAKVFDCHPEIPLRWNDFVSKRINWSRKSENIRSLAAELNLDLDSFLFIDDDSVECAEVSVNCPGVLTLHLPQSQDTESFLSHYWLFDTVGTTSEGARRTQLYLEDQERKEHMHLFHDMGEYIEGLQLKLETLSLGRDQLPRTVELMYRTNQFNTTGFRTSVHELRSLLESHELDGRAFRVTDRFGDYGLVGLVLFRQSDEDLIVRLMLLSCRALGRGVEHWIAAQCGQIAVDRGLLRVVFEFSHSSKNKPALRFLESTVGNATATPDGLLYQITAKQAAAIRPDYRSPVSTLESGRTQIDAMPPSLLPHLDAMAQSELFEHIAASFQTARSVVEAARRLLAPGLTDRVPLQAPTTPMEQKVARIWSELLGFTISDVQDDFFDLGGDSLKAVRVLSQLQKEFRVTLPLSLFFEKETTITTLCSAIAESLNETKHFV